MSMVTNKLKHLVSADLVSNAQPTASDKSLKNYHVFQTISHTFFQSLSGVAFKCRCNEFMFLVLFMTHFLTDDWCFDWSDKIKVGLSITICRCEENRLKARWPDLEERAHSWALKGSPIGKGLWIVQLRFQAIVAKEMNRNDISGRLSWCYRLM